MVGNNQAASAAGGRLAGSLRRAFLPRLFVMGAMVLASSLALPAHAAGGVNACATATVPCTEGTVVNTPAGGTTPMKGDVDRMISYGHQQHSWQTSDGYVHLMVNLGLANATVLNSSLVLMTSADNGKTFTQSASFSNTGNFSTSDGLLFITNGGDTYLAVAYSGNDVNNALEGGSIFYVVLKYDPVAHTWTPGTVTKAYDASANSAQFVALNPAITIDPQSRVWCGYVRETRVNYGATPPFPASTIRMAVGTTSNIGTPPTWQDTGLTFGLTDATTSNVERSARPVLITNGIGMIYTVHQSVFWTTRLNNWSTTRKWSAPSAILTSALPYDADPYESHFSVVEDTSNNINLAIVDHQRLLYFQYSDAAQRWGQPQVLMPATNPDNTATQGTYPKISLVSGNLLEIYVNDEEVIRVYESSDDGGSFKYAYLLGHDNITGSDPDNPANDGFQNPRPEVPSLWTAFTTPVTEAVFQQYNNGASGVTPPNSLTDTLQQLVNFQLPLTN